MTMTLNDLLDRKKVILADGAWGTDMAKKGLK